MVCRRAPRTASPDVAPHQHREKRHDRRGGSTKAREPTANPAQDSRKNDSAACTAHNHDGCRHDEGEKAAHVVVAQRLVLQELSTGRTRAG